MYPLPINSNRPRDSKPHIAYYASVIPPVIPGILRGFLTHGIPRDSFLGNAIVYLDGKIIGGLKMRSDVQRVCRVPTFMMTDLRTVQPNTRRVEGRSEVQFNMHSRRWSRRFKIPEIP